MDEHQRAEAERKRAENEKEFRYELKRWIKDELNHVWYTDEGTGVLLQIQKKIVDLEKDIGLV